MALRDMAIGVFVHGDPIAAIRKVKSLGLDNCQMLFPGPEWSTPEQVARLRAEMESAGVTVTCVFSGFPGESYADIPTIRDTVGLVPEGTRSARVDMSLEHAAFARAVGAPVLASHIGFVPDDHADPVYVAVVEAVRRICDRCAELGLRYALETGQERAPVLLQFLRDVDRPNLGVNFDPANMMLYGSGDPIEALGMVGEYVIGAHCKDGDYPTEPGTLGTEYPLGQGKVGFPRFIGKLKELGYRGPLTIEREIEGDQQTRDIVAAVAMLESIRG
ncbi:MAG TPA: sugar phosphate isomerase/epimerase family protein [Chthonomonadales bacterium]|nr:sugar phosphate isomerase/epimerase family protein [Chthonomonadales bacterium]